MEEEKVSRGLTDAEIAVAAQMAFNRVKTDNFDGLIAVNTGEPGNLPSMAKGVVTLYAEILGLRAVAVYGTDIRTVTCPPEEMAKITRYIKKNLNEWADAFMQTADNVGKIEELRKVQYDISEEKRKHCKAEVQTLADALEVLNEWEEPYKNCAIMRNLLAKTDKQILCVTQLFTEKLCDEMPEDMSKIFGSVFLTVKN